MLASGMKIYGWNNVEAISIKIGDFCNGFPSYTSLFEFLYVYSIMNSSLSLLGVSMVGKICRLLQNAKSIEILERKMHSLVFWMLRTALVLRSWYAVWSDWSHKSLD